MKIVITCAPPSRTARWCTRICIYMCYKRIRYQTCRPTSLIIPFDPLSGGSPYVYTIRADVYDQDRVQGMCHKSFYNMIITCFRLVCGRGKKEARVQIFYENYRFPSSASY